MFVLELIIFHFFVFLEGNMDQIISELQQIQSDLVGILIPSIISAIVSIISIFINTLLQLKLSDREYKSEQYKLMRNHYPYLKSILMEISCCYINLENNGLYDNSFNITDYIYYDWQLFRKKVPKDKIIFIDDYMNNIKKIVDLFLSLNLFFEKNNLPASYHSVQQGINELQFFCSYIKNCKNGIHGITNKIFHKKDTNK